MRWSERLGRTVSPARYLVIVNVLSSGLTFAKGIIVATTLGPAALGLVAVVSGLNRVTVNLVDVRLRDVAARLYFQTGERSEAEIAQYRASVMLTCVAGNTVLALIVALISVIAGWLLVDLFTDADIAFWWLVAAAAMYALASVQSAISFFQRFVGRFYLFGTIRLVLQTVEAAVFLALLIGIGGVDGYYIGNVASTAVMLILTLAVTVYVLMVWDGLPIFSAGIRLSLPDYRHNLGMLFYGNLLGYVKVIHRGVDVLIVGLFADDTVTGLYKFARTLGDSFHLLYDAMNTVYQPTILELLSQAAWEQYRALARRFVVSVGALTLAIIAVQGVLLEPLLNWVGAAEYTGSVPATMVMTLALFATTGCWLWMWPIFLHTGQVKRPTLAMGMAGLIQVGVTFALHGLFDPDPIYAAIAYVTYYAVHIPVSYRLLQREGSQYDPFNATEPAATRA